MHAPADAHIRFTLHPDHHPAVIATTSGPTSDAARSDLHDLGFRSTGPATMVLARIDRENPTTPPRRHTSSSSTATPPFYSREAVVVDACLLLKKTT